MGDLVDETCRSCMQIPAKTDPAFRALYGIPDDLFAGKCSCNFIVVLDRKAIIVTGQDACVVHGFGTD